METMRHQFQMDLLIDAMDLWLEARGDGFAGGNMFLYYSLEQVRHNTFVGPDFFVALDVPRGERKSWVIWEQSRGPDLVVELLSASTAQYDKTLKKTLYARQVHVPEYYWYDPFNPEDFAGFILHGGHYQPLVIDARGRIHSPILNLDLGRWPGTFRGIEAVWLARYERIFAKQKDAAIALVEHGTCGSCHMKLSPSQVVDARKPDTLTQCAFCGRMLYLPA